MRHEIELLVFNLAKEVAQPHCRGAQENTFVGALIVSAWCISDLIKKTLGGGIKSPQCCHSFL